MNKQHIMNTTFPHSKIKAQILLDRDGDTNTIGRVSSKAVDLIIACSALFVRDIVDNRNGDSNNCKSTTNSSSKAPKEASRNKRRRPDRTLSAAVATDVPSTLNTVLSLDNIRQNLQRPQYEFLDGTLNELTERNAPKYDAIARKRRRQQGKSKSVGETKKLKSRDAVVESIMKNDKHDDSGGVDRNAGDALQEAIEDAQEGLESAKEAKGIIEDDDDYD
jgi:hypothetical protein